MEGGKKSTGSSLASDLFGAKDAAGASSSSGVFSSIFASPANRGLGRVETDKKNDSVNPAWSAKNGVSGENGVGNGGQGQNTAAMDNYGSYYQEEKTQPCHYSSSIYYGGQDVYVRPQTGQSTTFTTFNKDGGEDDPNIASRGNWWKGSLYY